MPLSLRRRIVLAAVLWAVTAGAAVAGNLADFNAAVEAVSAQNRAARASLLGDNKTVAVVALSRLRAAWSRFNAEFAGKRPHVFEGNRTYVVMMTDISMRLVTADMMVNAGRRRVAWNSLQAMREDFHKLRQSAGIVVFADCVIDANKQMHALLAYDGRKLAETSPATRDAIAKLAANYGRTLDRCDAMASDAVRKSPEFHRIIDAGKRKLALIPKAIAARDANYLHRLLDDLRAIDNALALRFG